MARPYIELYIDNMLVEFINPPQIHITYAHEDLHNPTVLRNSYSKTVIIDSTPSNSKIFGNFYDMQRETVLSDTSYTGAYFNPSKKLPFALYSNGEMIEQGYCKLDNVKKTGEVYQYSITLYGILGQFLSNLSSKENGEMMRLSDLDYGNGDDDFKMMINKNTIRDAWAHITGVSNKPEYDRINFAPCYNGIPENFSADKVAININSFAATGNPLYDKFETSKDGYGTLNGWVIGELPKEYDEWQMKDLRSYLQRPVIRFKEIINACCNPSNNGGFDVVLDEEFFSEQNEYYNSAWMTLPLLTENENISTNCTTEVIPDGYKITFDDIDDIADGKFKIDLNFDLHSDISSDYGILRTGYIVPTYGYNRGYHIQLVVYDKDGNVVGGSKAYTCYSDIYLYSDFEFVNRYNSTTENVVDVFRFDDGKYKFAYGKYLNLSTNYMTYSEGMYAIIHMDTSGLSSDDVNDRYGDVLFKGSTPIDANVRVGIINCDVIRNGGGIQISKKLLLNSEHTPCDYFLSYLKLFNLHVYSDMTEKKIYIQQRKNYFHDEIIELDECIDRGSEIIVSPLTFDAKYYSFDTHYESSKLSDDYSMKYGLNYGIKKVDTNYNFDNKVKDLFASNTFKGCITSRNKSRYFKTFTDGECIYPPFATDGVQTFLYKGADTIEGTYLTPKTNNGSVDWFKDENYDFMPKPNFTDKDNDGIDGANVLLFYNGKNDALNAEYEQITFYVTDDIPEFKLLNDGEPCWIWDESVMNRYVAPLPQFSRYITNENGWITHSWDFGTPKAIYIPDYSIDDTSNLYDKFWKPYINDRYDVDTRIVECKVLLKERVLGDWLKRFYHWDGTLWLMNRITDYNPTSDECTKVEFVKVHDKNNYFI